MQLVCTSGIDAEIKVWDVGDERTGAPETRKRMPMEDFGSSSDWGRRRREAPPNATVSEAEQRIKEAELKKQSGNSKVKQGSWAEALELYQEGLRSLHFLPPNSE